ncbi:F-box/LRR-repeat protein 17 [Chelonia mydas]|uniref:F-box/LRR-repeat protein 17 n=1 Tax=Chelonia mydas TaxID=8469 RepID=M7BJW5_CHEMY|nr:F-box/LRR-repeat protein 17 [Chelonia mydas]
MLEIFSNLSLNERCLSASLVCKYWRDLCLDFQFWKQLDLSNRQQVTDELLEKIASRSQNISEINISDCRNVSDTGVCVLAFKCPGLLRYNVSSRSASFSTLPHPCAANPDLEDSSRMGKRVVQSPCLFNRYCGCQRESPFVIVDSIKNWTETTSSFYINHRTSVHGNNFSYSRPGPLIEK